MTPCCSIRSGSNRCRCANNTAVKIDQRILAELADLESQAQLRNLESVRGIDLSSNDYLGLSTDPRMKQAVLEAIAAAPRVASTGSRLLSGHDEVWTLLEKEFARWIGAEAALYFTSGYAANIGLLSAILGPDDVVFSDSANHASLIDGMRLAKCRRVVFPHLDLNALEGELRWSHSGSGARFMVVESIFSMDGDRAPLRDLATLARRYEAELIVDEAHATGVCGPEGRGCVAEAGLAGRVFATVHTCGKALAAAGAFVCGAEPLRQFLINRARTFIFGTALPPYLAAQVAAGMRLAPPMEAERKHLADISGFLKNELLQNGFETAGSDSQIVPIVLGSNETSLAFAANLQARGYGIRAIRPPTVPAGTARLRMSLTTKLTQSTLADLVGALIQIRKEIASGQAIPLSQ
jgi:8-amino-7-oxononanoate synthase